MVATEAGRALDEQLRRLIATTLPTQRFGAPHLDEIEELPVVPRNLTGKKLELPVKHLLQGTPLAKVASADALAVPTSLNAVVDLARTRATAATKETR